MSLFFMEYTLLHGNTKLQALIHKLAEWFQSQNVQLEILYGPFFFSHCQGSTFQKLCQGPNTFHIYLVGLANVNVSNSVTRNGLPQVIKMHTKRFKLSLVNWSNMLLIYF